jgi:hypothetical protein
MSVSCECCVLSGRGLCGELIPRPEESYRLWCVSNVCDHETSTKRGGPIQCCRAIGRGELFELCSTVDSTQGSVS